MKRKRLVGMIAALFLAVSLTACNSSEKAQVQESSVTSSATHTEVEANTAETQLEAPVTPPEGVEEVDLQEFSQLVGFYETDPNYDRSKMGYEIYLQRVNVSEATAENETEVVVVGRVMNNENQKSFVGPIAANKDYVIDGEVFEAKTQWWNEGTPYSADSIISAALKEYGISEGELELEQKYVLVSTFEN